MNRVLRYVMISEGLTSSLLGAFEKLRKAAIISVVCVCVCVYAFVRLSVRLFVRMEHTGSHRTEFHEI